MQRSSHDQGKNAKLAFGRAVKKLRLRFKLSQELLAAKAQINRTYLGDVERGQRNVAIVNIDKIATAFGISLAELMTAVDKELAKGDK